MTAVDLPSQTNHLAHRASQGTAVEQARAVAEVAAAVQVAQQNPRDITRAVEQMRISCHQKALAERAFYSLPRAGTTIEGETVHLAREIGRCWGNLDHGIRELRRDDEAGVSEMQAWAWDQEQNVRASRSFIVPHARMAKDRATGVKRREPLIDLADIANNNNSVAARAVREAIFQVVPPWFKAEAVDICNQTLQDGGGKTPEQQTADAINHYRTRFGITVEQLEQRLDRKHDRWTPQNLGFLRVLAGELARGEKQVQDEFPPEESHVTAAEILSRRKATSVPADPEGVTDAQLRKIMATYNDLGIVDRDERLADIAAVVGRDVASSKDLTKDEASRLIERLTERAQAALFAGQDEP